MTDYAVEFYVDSRFPSGAKQWLADQKIFHHAESLRITGGDEVSAVTYRVRLIARRTPWRSSSGTATSSRPGVDQRSAGRPLGWPFHLLHSSPSSGNNLAFSNCGLVAASTSFFTNRSVSFLRHRD